MIQIICILFVIAINNLEVQLSNFNLFVEKNTIGFEPLV